MTYKHVKCPEYIKTDPSTGSLKSVQCKLCGVVIADTVDRIVGYETSRGGQLVKVVRRQFTRFANYCEIKVAFEGTLYSHITHGCRGCLAAHMSPAVLSELHTTDQDIDPDGYTEREKEMNPSGVAVLRLDQSGIV